MQVIDDLRTRSNSVLYELLNAMDVVQRRYIQRLQWLGHVVRMQEDAPAKRVFDVDKEDDLVCVEEALSSIGVNSCRRRLNKVVLFADFLRSPHQITGTSYCIRTTWPSQCSERSVKADRNTLIRLLMAN